MDRFAKWVNPPKVDLFHYTDTNGLLGIADHCEMWATHVRHLNDTAEYFSTLDRIKGALDDRLKDVTFRDTAWTPRHALREMREQDVYVICFSEERNLLSQWRAYCPSEGYVIGFTPDDLAPLSRSGDTMLSKCVYEWSDQEEIIQAISAYLIEEFSDRDSRGPDWSSGPIISRAVHHAALIKNIHFREECEWRFIASEPLLDDIHYRRGRLGLTPYLTFPLRSERQPGGGSPGRKKLVCSSLTVGPRADERASIIAALNFATSNLYNVDTFEVIYCDIPFRQ